MHFIKSWVSASRFLFRLAILVCAALQFCFGVTKEIRFRCRRQRDFQGGDVRSGEVRVFVEPLLYLFPRRGIQSGALTGDTNQKNDVPDFECLLYRSKSEQYRFV